MPSSNKPRIVGRFLCFSGISVLGAISFLPYGMPSSSSFAQQLLFVIVVSAVCMLAAWFGLRLADATHLPMPFLRRLDLQSEPSRGGGLIPAIVCGVVFAAGAIYVLRYFRVQNMPGSLPSRLGSVLFAAGNLEIILHLFIMSLAVWLARGRIWVGIAAATFFYIGFHSAGAFGQSAPLLACTILLNGSFGVLLGIFYARYGYEYLMLSHAIAHGLAVGLG